MQWEWKTLYNWQQDEDYKRWSGFGLAMFILFQWSLSIVRVKKSWEASSWGWIKVHKWLGALTPVFFYFHAMKFGYAYLLVLSVCFFSNFVLGLMNTDLIKTKAYWYFQGWMIFHVALSLIITVFTLFHIYIVFYYK